MDSQVPQDKMVTMVFLVGMVNQDVEEIKEFPEKEVLMEYLELMVKLVSVE